MIEIHHRCDGCRREFITGDVMLRITRAHPVKQDMGVINTANDQPYIDLCASCELRLNEWMGAWVPLTKARIER